MSAACLALLATASLLAQQPSASPPTTSPPSAPLLVVLAPTGDTRDGLAVYRRHPNAAAVEGALARGFSGRLLALFRWEQQFLARRDGSRVEPAYLLLSTNQGGFPRFGFWLEGEKKDGVGYVDLQQSLPLSGEFGALDQIFPHELMHVIVHQLAGLPPPGAGGANQVHAVGVRTDRITAFDEGFAEHAQVMAVDDRDARPDTRALPGDAARLAFANDRLARYRRALTARWALAPPARMGFVLWFSQAEQVLRYHAVKANAFAHEPAIPPRLLERGDRYPAYLLENVLPGSADAPVKSTPRLLSTEGVIAALFSRWAEDASLQQPVSDPSFYDRFGIWPGDVQPVEQVYLKLFAVLADRRPHDAASLIGDYIQAFPADTGAVADVVRSVGLDWPLPDVPEIWLANDAFMTGTTLFDQFRAAPRVHTFDLNAASLVDLLTVEGVSMDLAAAIQRGAPYASLEDLARVPGITAPTLARFAAMQRAMAQVREANAREDIESINLMRLFTPVIWRAVAFVILGAAAGAWLYGRVRRVAIWRLAANGFAASLVGFGAAWVLGAALQVRGRGVEPALLAFVPVLVFGMSGAFWRLVRTRSLGAGLRVAAAWAMACVPALVVAQPMF